MSILMPISNRAGLLPGAEEFSADIPGAQKIETFIQGSSLFAWAERLIEAFHDVWLWIVSLVAAPAPCAHFDYFGQEVDSEGLESTLETIPEALRPLISAQWADPFLALQGHMPEGVKWREMYLYAENRNAWLNVNDVGTYTVTGSATYKGHLVVVITEIFLNEEGEVETKQEVMYKKQQEFMQPKEASCTLRNTYHQPYRGALLLENFYDIFVKKDDLPFDSMTVGDTKVENVDQLISAMKELGDFAAPSMKVVQHYLVDPFRSIVGDFRTELEVIGVKTFLAYMSGTDKKVSLTFESGTYRIEAELSYGGRKITVFIDIDKRAMDEQNAPIAVATVSLRV